MTVTELTKEIYDKYPKVWKKIKEAYHEDKICKSGLNFHHVLVEEDIITINEIRSALQFPIPFNMLYGLLEDFFEENGIIITVDFNRSDREIWDYLIHTKERYYLSKEYKSKTEAKQQAILKACEILEGRLK